LNRSPAENFLSIAEDWLCDQYTLSINYLAQRSGSGLELINASITAAPWKPAIVEGFHIQTSTLLAGQKIIYPATKDEIRLIFQAAIDGALSTDSGELTIGQRTPLSLYSESNQRGNWYTNLHLNVAGSQITPLSQAQSALEDHELRCNELPFDGINDLCNWLELKDERATGRAASIDLRIMPPVDIIFDDSSIFNDELNLTLYAHSNLDTSKIKLSIKAYPGIGLESRFRAERKINWSGAENGISKGVLSVQVKEAESALGMLTLGNQTIRRQWFIDPSKSKNIRYSATQFFDHELRQIKHAALESNDSRKLEPAIATLLYLLGFSTSNPIEKDAPDIIATTPSGNIIIIECTTRIGDFSQKLGKLVDRKNGLSKALHSAAHHSKVHAALVCNLPSDQIAFNRNELFQHEIMLATKEDISRAFDLTKFKKDPDELLDNAIQELIRKKDNQWHSESNSK
jgi:hypothetical protein